MEVPLSEKKYISRQPCMLTQAGSYSGAVRGLGTSENASRYLPRLLLLRKLLSSLGQEEEGSALKVKIDSICFNANSCRNNLLSRHIANGFVECCHGDHSCSRRCLLKLLNWHGLNLDLQVFLICPPFFFPSLGPSAHVLL